MDLMSPQKGTGSFFKKELHLEIISQYFLTFAHWRIEWEERKAKESAWSQTSIGAPSSHQLHLVNEVTRALSPQANYCEA